VYKFFKLLSFFLKNIFRMEVFRELDVRYRTLEKELVRFVSRNIHGAKNESENDFEEFGELYASAMIESNEQKRKIISKIKDIKYNVQNCKIIIQQLGRTESNTYVNIIFYDSGFQTQIWENHNDAFEFVIVASKYGFSMIIELNRKKNSRKCVYLLPG
jgi:hypothetical protein